MAKRQPKFQIFEVGQQVRHKYSGETAAVIWTSRDGELIRTDRQSYTDTGAWASDYVAA